MTSASVSTPAVETTVRTTLGLPIERFEQLRSLANARQVAPAALVEEWIARAVANGEPGAIDLPGYWAIRDDNVIAVQIAGRSLPMLSILDALKLSMGLDAAAPTGGKKLAVNMKGDFTLMPGAGFTLEYDAATLVVVRKGRGVLFHLTDKATGKVDRFSAPTSYVADLASLIRNAVDNV